MSGILDLSGADTTGFDPVPSNRYNIRIHKYEMTETGPNSKVPGTPMLKLQLKIVDGDYKDKIIFDQFTLPPADRENADKMLGFFVRFLIAIGYEEKTIKSKGFALTKLEDIVGREAVATVVEVPANPEKGYDASNNVKGYKPAGSMSATGSGGGLI